MLETAIVGGGLCGLALARSLSRRGVTFALFEARRRLGGRIMSAVGAGGAIDLGPTWFWPDTQPSITRLVADLGLADFPQHDEGAVLHLRDPDKAPEAIEGRTIHNGARRLQGGMASLVDALARDLPKDHIHLGHQLTRVEDRGDHVALAFGSDGRMIEVVAQRIVLALPPRLVAEHVRFEPELDEATREAMRDAETWMAAQAKVVIGYDRPFWREGGRSGNAFVTHEQAVLGEIFDACDAPGERAALGGFLALPPDLRQSFSVGLPMLMASQMVQVFGPALEQGQGEPHYQDWATERHTCSALDREGPRAEHVDVASPLLRRPLWDGKLHLGGAETAAHAAGYLEGALDAARRIDRALGRASSSNGETGGRTDASLTGNAACLARLGAWVAAQGDVAFDDYRRRLIRGLAAQQRDQITQLAALGAVEAVFAEALKVLDDFPFEMSGVAVERGRSALTPDVQKPFGDFLRTLLDDVIAFNRTSCALSNFPDEHRPSKEYVQTILRDIAAAWQEFSLAANRLLLAKADASPARASARSVSRLDELA
ncbi:MAG: FAD-dependent oxidoreductase [Xanthobacteraceae bacterium]|nr:FAD-dependent oxidoreductase [Xanthobacteraceae bacterium]